jgi:hypothetical protein
MFFGLKSRKGAMAISQILIMVIGIIAFAWMIGLSLFFGGMI